MAECIIAREAAAVLASKFESQFTGDDLRRGFQLYAEGAVSHAWLGGFSIVHGIVKDGRDVKLQLDLDFFEASECGCGERRCAHMAAVFFTVYAEHGRPREWLDDVLALRFHQTGAGSASSEGAATEEASEPGLRGRNGGVHPASPHAGAAHFRPEGSADSPERWPEMLKERLEELQRRHSGAIRIDIFHFTAYKKLVSIADGWEETAGQLFKLHAALYLLVRMDRHFAERASDYSAAYYRRVTDDLYAWFAERVRDAAMRIDARELKAGYRRHGEAVARMLRSGWSGEPAGPFDWAEIGRFLWSSLLADTGWLEEDRRVADELLSACGSAGARAARLSAISAHLNWLLGRDGEAMSKLKHPDLAPLPLIATYIETLFHSASWRRLAAWLEFSLPYLRRASADQFRRIIGCWREYALRQGEERRFMDALAALLPRSYPQYADFLLATERYREWTDFHLLNGIPPGKIDRAQLEKVEKRDVRLLFPLYHHAIERQISARSRASYREAVKLMKRLRDLYLAAGEEARFRLFAGVTAARHQRLHAFREELAKGKMLE